MTVEPAVDDSQDEDEDEVDQLQHVVLTEAVLTLCLETARHQYDQYCITILLQLSTLFLYTLLTE